jgi:hypothetical protein
MNRLAVSALTVVAFSFVAAVGGEAKAQSACNSGSKVITAIWAQWGERIKAKQCKSSEECLANTQKKEELFREMITFWNQQAQGSWATIGPRPLLVAGAKNDGKVLAGGSRLFVSQTPLESDTWEVIVTKEGNGAAEVTVSSSDGVGCTQGPSVTFAKSDKNGTKKRLTLTGANGRIGVVKVDARGTDAFDYEFTFVKK